MTNGVGLICFYGPESTGKSVMAQKMAAYYQTEFVPEVAREIVSSNDFSVEEIIEIGKAQNARVLEKSKIANQLLFCDTDLITTQIYCRHYLKQVPPILFDLEREVTFDLYFLFNTDVPWVADGMRDLGSARKEMFQTFKFELDTRLIPYHLVQGDWNTREKFIVSKIDQRLLNSFKR